MTPRNVAAVCLACAVLGMLGCPRQKGGAPAAAVPTVAGLEARLASYLQTASIVDVSLAESESPAADNTLRTGVAGQYASSRSIRGALAVHYLQYAAQKWRRGTPTDQAARES